MSTAEANQQHWTKNAKQYKKMPGADKVFAQVTHNLQSQLDWLSLTKASRDQTKILDYACGPGAASHALSDCASLIIGVDSAEGMVQEYNQQVESLGIDSSTMFAVQCNLLEDEPNLPRSLEEHFGTFDLLVVSLGFHHFDAPATVIAKLLKALKSGGRLVILDFLEHSNFDKAEDTEVQKTIGHGGQHGFTEEQVGNLFSSGGCVEVEVRRWKSVGAGGEGQIILPKASGDFKFDVFTCRGVKP